MIAADLRKAEARYQRAFRRCEEAREARNATVRAALTDGWTHARISEATGLTRSRVGQIALRQPESVEARRERFDRDIGAGPND